MKDANSSTVRLKRESLEIIENSSTSSKSENKIAITPNKVNQVK